jgi:HlyD family secretion protein
VTTTSTLRRRLAFWAVPLLALLLGLVWLFRPVPVPVDLVAVQRGPLQVSVAGEGQTRVQDVFAVSAPIPGLMRRIELKVGDPVQGGKTVIARIEPSDPAFLDPRSAAEARAARDAAAAARSYAQAQVRSAEAERDFAALEYERIQILAERGAISKSELDAANRRMRTAAAALEVAQAGLRMRESEYVQAQARLLAPRGGQRASSAGRSIEVHSPVSGTVLRVATESEGVVQAGAPLVEIGDPAKLEVVVDLLSADAVRVHPGLRVIIEAWGGDHPIEASVRSIEPYGFTKISALGIEEQRVNVIIDLAEPRERWIRLGHGYRVEPRIVLWEASDVLRIPRAALFRQEDRWAVFVEDGGRAALRRVEIGHDNGLETEILSGLAPGQRLVLHPSERVTAGARLVARG